MKVIIVGLKPLELGNEKKKKKKCMETLVCQKSGRCNLNRFYYYIINAFFYFRPN